MNNNFNCCLYDLAYIIEPKDFARKRSLSVCFHIKAGEKPDHSNIYFIIF